MARVRQVIAYKNFFEDFLRRQPRKVQDKIYEVIEIIESYEMVPTRYLKPIKGNKKLNEARIKLGSNIWRVFCFFDEGKLVILLNGFQKKTQKTPRSEVARAARLMQEYFNEKTKNDE